MISAGPIAAEIGNVGGPRLGSQERLRPLTALTCFLLGLGFNLHVQVIGYLPLSELAITISIPFLLPRLTSRAVLTYARVPLLLGALWMLTQVATDMYLQTRPDLAARGFARSLLFLLMVPFFVWYMQSQTYRRLLFMTAGMILSLILSAYVLRSGAIEGRELTEGYAEINWQTHWGTVIGMVNRFTALVLYCRWHFLAYLVSAGLGSLNLVFGSRASGATPIIAVASCWGYNVVKHRGGGRRLGGGRLLLLIAIVAAGSAAVYNGYKRAASEGALGRAAQEKFEYQSQSRFGIFSGGRGAVITGLLAVAESPIVGYGSWPLDNQGFYLKGCEFLGEKPERTYYQRGFPVIPSHSHIIGTWVEGGILAIWFWVYALYLTGTVFFRPLRHDHQLRLWASVSGTSLIWNILFSPIGARMLTALTLAVFLLETKWRAVHVDGSEKIPINFAPKGSGLGPERGSPRMEPVAR